MQSQREAQFALLADKHQRKRGTIHASWTCAVRRDGNLFDQYVSEVLAMKSWIIYNMPTEYLLY